jgi:hypothetical protein
MPRPRLTPVVRPLEVCGAWLLKVSGVAYPVQTVSEREFEVRILTML